MKTIKLVPTVLPRNSQWNSNTCIHPHFFGLLKYVNLPLAHTHHQPRNGQVSPLPPNPVFMATVKLTCLSLAHTFPVPNTISLLLTLHPKFIIKGVQL